MIVSIFNQIKKLKFFIVIFFIFFHFSSLNAEVKFIKTLISSTGSDQQDAIDKALFEALSQINGTIMDGKIIQNEMENYSLSNGEEISNYHSSYEKELNKKSGGIIKEYQILDTINNSDGTVTVKVRATLAKYALSKQASRKRIAVMPFRISDSRSLSVNGLPIDQRRVLGLLNQEFVSYLTQTRKFFVSDRDFVDEISSVKNQILGPNTPVEEFAKIGIDLGVDLILVGVIEDFNTSTTKKVYKSVNKSFTSSKGIVEISYRIIDVTTKQIKLAELYTSDEGVSSNNPDTSMIQAAALNIGQNILYSIYPVRVEEMLNDGTLYLGQGGKQFEIGDIYQVFKYGKQIKDSYTGEILGKIEIPFAEAEIINVTSKITTAKIINNESKDFSIETDLIVRPKKKKNIIKAESIAEKIKSKKIKKENDADELW